MRATISFEIELERVNETMLALIKTETDSIRGAAHTIETTQPHQLEQKLVEAVEQLQRNVHQLEQYQSMLVSFARAKFETMVPQSADGTLDGVISDVKSMKENIKKLKDFDKFVDKVNESTAKVEEMVNESKKG